MMADRSEFEVRDLSELKNLCGSLLNNLQRSTNGFKHRIEFVDSVEKAKQACDQLGSFTELAFDCEGVDLGRGGKLTLIQLMAKDDKIFIFDVLALGESVFQNTGLREILESKEIRKVMFDCRCDSDSLWEEYKVKLTNVLDMQLFEYMVRPIAGTSLRGANRPWHVRKPCIRGLDKSVSTYVRRSDLLNDIGIRDFESMKKSGGELMRSCHTVWRYRPLHQGLERYAALDVVILHLVKEALTKKLPMQGVQLERLEVASERYVSVRRDFEKPDDVYIRNCLLLSYIIPEMTGGRLKAFPREDTKCLGCKRMFCSSYVVNNKCEDCREIERVNRHRR